MDRPAAAEEAGEIDQVAVDQLLHEEREPEGPRRQRLRLHTRGAGEHALAPARLVDLHHERIAERFAGGDEGACRFDDGEPWHGHAGLLERPREPHLRPDMTKVLRPGDRQEPARYGAVERGVADLADEIVVAGDDQTSRPRLPVEGCIDPTRGRLEGKRLPHHP